MRLYLDDAAWRRIEHAADEAANQILFEDEEARIERELARMEDRLREQGIELILQ